jgi:hypothetical protein
MTRRETMPDVKTMEDQHAHVQPSDAPACRLCRRRAAALAPGGQADAAYLNYRFKPGFIEVTIVSDGTLVFPAETLWKRSGR